MTHNNIMHDLQKGSNIALATIFTHYTQLKATINWCRQTGDETEFDIDASAFLLNESKKISHESDFIFYNQAQNPEQSIQLITLDNNSQQFIIHLANIAPTIQTIAFVLTLHEAKQREQNFSQLASINILLNNSTDNNTVRYNLTNISTETALILGELYRYQNDWKFRAVGQGFNDGLDILARGFGVAIDAEPIAPQTPKKLEPKTATVLRYIEAIKQPIARYQELAIIAKRDLANESRTRLLIDSLLKNFLGYSLENIKTEQKIPKRNTRADYVIALAGNDILVVEAKSINETLKETHVSQVSAYAYYLQLDFALLTNGIQCQLYYIERKKLKKYTHHLVFAINLLAFDDKVAEKLFSISRYGAMENSFSQLKLKAIALNEIADIILQDVIIEQITTALNNKYAGCQLSYDDVLYSLEHKILN